MTRTAAMRRSTAGSCTRRPAKDSTPSSSTTTSPTDRCGGLDAAEGQPVQPGEEVPLVGGGPDHVLEGVDRRRGHPPGSSTRRRGRPCPRRSSSRAASAGQRRISADPPPTPPPVPTSSTRGNLGRLGDGSVPDVGRQVRDGSPDGTSGSHGAEGPGAGRPRAGARGRRVLRGPSGRSRPPGPRPACGRGPGPRCPGRRHR